MRHHLADVVDRERKPHPVSIEWRKHALDLAGRSPHHCFKALYLKWRYL